MVSFDEIYGKISKTMGELQPIAFLLSASLVISGLYAHYNYSFNYIYSLLASGSFFFAYIGFMGFRLTNFKWFLILGIISLIDAIYSIFRACIGIMALAINQNNNIMARYNIPDMTSPGLLQLYFYGFITILTVYTVITVKNYKFKDDQHKKVMKFMLYSSYFLVVIISFLPGREYVITDIKVDMITEIMFGALDVDLSVLSLLIIDSILKNKSVKKKFKELDN